RCCFGYKSSRIDILLSPSSALFVDGKISMLFINRNISATKLIDVMKSFRLYTSKEEVKQMKEEIDTGCDGFINLDEFVRLCNDIGFDGDGGDWRQE
ncbi:hypothetical protein U1Q18_036085, partial [Sarracenia purpurea var. burkii]